MMMMMMIMAAVVTVLTTKKNLKLGPYGLIVFGYCVFIINTIDVAVYK